MSPKKLLLVVHSKSGKTSAMADAVEAGATLKAIDGVEVIRRSPFNFNAQDLLEADALILGTPENFGYMSGAMKDFFDRTFYEVEGKIRPLPYSVFIGAGNDGTGALTSIQRIAQGYPFIEVQPPVIVAGELNDERLQQCRELGLAMAAGLEAGIY